MHITEATRSVNGQSENYSQPGIGHNSYVDFDGAIERNRQTSAYLLCREMLITAIQDRRLDRSHLKVLAAIASKMAESRLYAWPDRVTIADATGMSPKSVSNVIGQLRALGYLIVDRRDVAEAGGRNLMVYTFGNIDHDTIRRVIAETCRELMADRTAKQSTRRSPVPAGSSRPSGNRVPVPAGTDFPS